MRTFNFFTLSLATTFAAANELTVNKVVDLAHFQVENLAVRQNGQVLVTTSAPAATLWQIDPTSNRNATLALSLPGVSGSYGITELQPDVFYVTAGNFSIQTRQPVPNSFQLFEVNMTSYRQRPDGTVVTPPQVRRITTFSDAIVLNGLTHVDGQAGYVLAADSFAGVVWKADVATGEVTTAIKDASMQPTPNKAAGINGLKYQNGSIYYTNTGNNLFYRLAISADATASGTPQVIANVTKGDDFILDSQGNAYICQQVNALSRVGINGTVELLAGTPGSNMSSLLGPTAAAWGRLPRDQNNLYISTNGGQTAAASPDSQGLSRIEVGSASASTPSPSSSGSPAPTSSSVPGAATILFPYNTIGSYLILTAALLFVL
ncbi:hypothetical protein F5884DRAFT_694806 [Xylogone sp. PMI_703]|nr:hypothetical protein F5884DRAFT_694806 [Xylogone sp. PMI_703]